MTTAKYPADVQPVLATDIFYGANNCPNGTDLPNNLESWGMDPLDTKIELPKLPRLTDAQKRVLLSSAVHTDARSAKALERKGVLRWDGANWAFTRLGWRAYEAVRTERALA